jgi:hypothetical protein
MPSPTITDVHVSTPLTNVSISYAQSSTAFVHNRIFPIVPVQKDNDQYYEWDRGDLLRTAAAERAPGTFPKERNWRLSQGSYHCNREAVAHLLADPVADNADPAVNLPVSITKGLTNDLMLTMEADWATTFFGTAIWDGASSSTDMTGQAAPASTASNFLQWNDAASLPIEDIAGEANAIGENTGRRPNRLVLGAYVWTWLQNHPDILDRIKYTQRGIVTTDLLAALFNLESVEVMHATRNTGPEEGTDSIAYIGGYDALLCYTPGTAALDTPSAGYSFRWTARGPQPRTTRERIPGREGELITTEAWYDHVVTSSVLGAFFTSAVSTG